MDKALMQNAFTHYGRMEYDKALDIYQKAFESGITSADLFYNLANCHYKLGNFSSARLFFEKAQLMKPLDSSIAENLEAVKTKIGVSEEILFKNLFEHVLDIVSGILHSSHWAIIFFILSWGSLVFFYFKKRFWFFLTGFSAIIVLLLGYYRFKFEKNSGFGIVVSNKENVELKVAPETLSPKIYEIKNGSKVVVEEVLGEWTKIWIDGNKEGWIKNEDIKEI